MQFNPMENQQLINAEDESTINFIDYLLNNAIDRNASDIHFEPYKNHYRIRFRIDGILYLISQHTLATAASCTSRLKIISNLNIAEKRLPQDGRFTFQHHKQKQYDCRFSSCPTAFGEKIVIRILNTNQSFFDLEKLGIEQKQLALIYPKINAPQGMILVTGPTGSGKTITLYSIINYLNRIEKNISTVEDPIEINLFGINQVEANQKIGLDFATALRTFLRQDPDIIMVGEIRDRETAEAAIRAAQTGHLVLSTLHTNSASETLTRLLNLGIHTFNIASSISLIIAQRLVRKLCPECKEATTVPTLTLIEEGFKQKITREFTLYRPKGCSACESGYHGRTGIFEVLPLSAKITQMLMRHKEIRTIEEAAQNEGITTLREAALKQVMLGITSLEEVNRVLS